MYLKTLLFLCQEIICNLLYLIKKKLDRTREHPVWGLSLEHRSLLCLSLLSGNILSGLFRLLELLQSILWEALL